MIPKIVYLLCFLTSLTCAFLLLRGYIRDHVRFLLWCGLCFIGLAINNLLVFIDLVVLSTEISLAPFRPIPALAGLMILIYGLVWDVA